MNETVPLFETPIETSNVAAGENSTAETILSEYGIEVSKNVLDIMNDAVASNFTRNTLRKILTALYDEIDPIYRDVYKTKVVPKLSGLSEGKQTLLDEFLKTYNLTQSDIDKDSEIRRRSKAIEQLLEKQRKAAEEGRERFAMYGNHSLESDA
ncbi:unnamed protein product [Cylicocyclus nassatus]|uniref:Uncharacterized protein n=1 Tax=Cylicocyclus nassatus TaxID=53992 RepID=A0AA36M4Q1_CYLNA|nr:unnamed protein product [Cylicocyclus nassatus]